MSLATIWSPEKFVHCLSSLAMLTPLHILEKNKSIYNLPNFVFFNWIDLPFPQAPAILQNSAILGLGYTWQMHLIQACVSQSSRRCFGSERLFYEQAIFWQRFNFRSFWKLSNKILRRWETFCDLKEIEFQNRLSGPTSLWPGVLRNACQFRVHGYHIWSLEFNNQFYMYAVLAEEQLASKKSVNTEDIIAYLGAILLAGQNTSDITAVALFTS